jgi:hypothetical protein
MDIHPPLGPLMSWREILLHLGIVTIGILIALSLEGLVEWNHHRHLVREARENIRIEIEDNQKELTGHLKQVEKIRSDYHAILQWIADLRKSHKSSIHSLSVTFNRAELQNTSWSTAQVMGALSLMSYSEVKKDAALYQVQDEFVRLQTRAEDAVIASMAVFTSHGDPSEATPAELSEEQTRVENSLTALLADEQIGKQLNQRYAAYLGGK